MGPKLAIAAAALVCALVGRGDSDEGAPGPDEAEAVRDSGDITRLALVAGDDVIELNPSADCSAAAEAERVVAPPCGEIDPEPTVVPLPSGDELTLVSGEEGASLSLLRAARGGPVPPPTEPALPLEVVGEGDADADGHTFRMRVDPTDLQSGQDMAGAPTGEATFQVTPAATDSGFVRFNVRFAPVE